MRLVSIRFILFVGLVSISFSVFGGGYSKDLTTAKLNYYHYLKGDISNYTIGHFDDLNQLELELNKIIKLINQAESHPENKNNAKLLGKIYLLKAEVFTDLARVIKTMIYNSISKNIPVVTIDQPVAGFTLHQAVEAAQSAISNAYQNNQSDAIRYEIDNIQIQLNSVVNEFNKVFAPQ
ncbi:MAG: hypothetical protein AB8B80_13165 [Marinicellaceae bacterium]